MTQWCPCGAPLYPYTPDHSGCRVCWLVNLTSQQVIWHEQERLGYTAEGEAIGAVQVWSTLEDLDFSPEPFNSTEGTKATSTWAPRNGEIEPCRRCGCKDDTVLVRPQNTAYESYEQNFCNLCDECQVEADAEWQEQWDEYYSGRL
jgi:hypothetical protein